ncbi:MAG TPA: efflux RND transporter permease subunit [Cytophagaceae bacterium]|jgi:multidrug efflux pump|nr:efflux RND transporter permease subunit [Cytophagaceae bacterium]
MSLSSISIRRPVLAIVMNLIILFFGYMGFRLLGVREFPVIEAPAVQVRTTYAGASADIVEAQITYPLEKALNGIEGVRTISSSSSLGASSIAVEFNLDANLESVTNDVRDKVSQTMRSLPPDLDAPPVVSKDAGSEYIIVMTVTNDKMTDLEVNDYVDNIILPRLQTINGVANVYIFGEKRYAMRLWLDPIKLAAHKITIQDVKQALDKENIELPTGRLEGNRTELTIKANAKFKDANGFNNMIIRSEGQQIVRLQDIGYASLGAENEETIFRINNVPSLGCSIVPQPGANHVEIAEEFYKRFEQLKKELPPDFKLGISTDNTRFIHKSITEVTETLIFAILLVVIIIYLFFRDWSIALRPLIDIPVSLVGTFFIMYLCGFSINVLTLLAIVLATGLVVDDGIVVTENIFKKSEQGMPPFQAAIEGSQEIAFAVLSTSITLAAIFLPIIFMQGFVGKLFKEFGIIVASAVLISIFVSLTLTPMLNAWMIHDTKKKTKFYIWSEPFFVWMNETYARSLNTFLKRRWIAFIILGAAVGLTVVIWKILPAEVAPTEDRSMMRITMTLPEGASFEYTDEFMLKYIKLIQDSVPENKLIMAITASSPGGSSGSGVNSGFSRVPLIDPSERERSQQEIVDKLQQQMKKFPEAKVQVGQDQTISTGARGLPVQYVIQAPNFEKLREALPKFMEEAQKDPTFSLVDVNLKFNRPEIQVLINREKARMLGVNVSDIAQTLQLALSGQRFGFFNMNGRQYQIIGQFDRLNRNATVDLKNIYVRSANASLIAIDNLVDLQETSSPPQLFRFNRYQSATVSAALTPGKTIGDGVKAMNEIKAKVLDDSFSTALIGPSRDLAESSSNTTFIFALALILVYLILAAQFESFVDPFIIMLTVPLAVAGGLLSLWYFNQTNNIFSQIGMIMLIGLVTKNGILIVEFANHLKHSGRTIREAAIEAANGRLRPILMTSLATILGALPIAIAFGAAGKSRMGMGIVIVGGLLISLIFTLYVIPSVYIYLARKPRTKGPDNEVKIEKVKLEEEVEALV